MSEIVLTGLDGSQLLGFLGGLGVLDILNSTMTSDWEPPRLGWRYADNWRPVVTGVRSIDEVADRILVDVRSELVADVLGFRYLKVEKRGAKEIRALTPPLAVLRSWTRNKLEAGRWQAANYAACLMCETATDRIGEDKAPDAEDLAEAGVPFDGDLQLDEVTRSTPFDFTSRNTQFLDQIRHVRDALSLEVILQELREGMGARSERIMRWDMLTDLPAALFSGVQPTPRPAAEWLVFRGLTFFGLAGKRSRIAMAGLTGRRKAGRFSWVLWDGLLPRDLVRSTLGYATLLDDRAERDARGCLAGFSVGLVKDATGYDGSVSPSGPIEGPA